MRNIAAIFVLVGLAALPAAAQGRGGRYNERNQGVPPGQLPPAGQCRVWYDGRPPGQQPRSTSCNNAERIASRDRDARVIYGTDRNVRGNGRNDSNNDRNRGKNDRNHDNDRDHDNDRIRGVLSRLPIFGYPNGRSGGGYQNDAFNNGYTDGVEKGREDRGDRDSYDPVRHSRYRAGDHGYNSRYGSKDDYKLVYRDGFEAGYGAGYRGTTRR